jgi:hypothetical protein
VATYWFDGNWKGAIRVYDKDLNLAWEKTGLPSGKKDTLTYADGKLVGGAGNGWVQYTSGDWKHIAAYAIDTGAVVWKCDLSRYDFRCVSNMPYYNGCFYAEAQGAPPPTSKVFRIRASDGKLEEVLDYGRTNTSCATCIIARGRILSGDLYEDRTVVTQIAEGSNLDWPGPFGDPQLNQMALPDEPGAKIVPMQEIGQRPTPETARTLEKKKKTP